jgi:hypothetical protein
LSGARCERLLLRLEGRNVALGYAGQARLESIVLLLWLWGIATETGSSEVWLKLLLGLLLGLLLLLELLLGLLLLLHLQERVALCGLGSECLLCTHAGCLYTESRWLGKPRRLNSLSLGLLLLQLLLLRELLLMKRVGVRGHRLLILLD